jgi:riboflavin kinase
MAVMIAENIHLPDLSFSQHCEQLFGINRGVYNTIDCWFYSKGITDILNRRKMMLEFLASEETNSGRERRFRRFGHGGLSAQLDHYWQEKGYA